jgi:hypothetical protein
MTTAPQPSPRPQPPEVDPTGLTDPDELEPLDQVRDDIRLALEDVLADAVLAEMLTTVRLPRQMTVTSAEARDRAGVQALEERAMRRNRGRRAGEKVGHAWLRRGDDAIVRDAVPAPANVHAVSIGDEISRALHHITIDLADYDNVRGVPQLRGLGYVVHTINDIRARVATCLWSPGQHDEEAERAPLERSRDALTELADTTRKFFEGQEQRTHLRNFDCPHCGQRSLIVFWAKGITRCDRVPGNPHYQPCVCRNSLCECKNRPVAHRHTWFRFHPQSFTTSWEGLQRLLAPQGAAPTRLPDDPPLRPKGHR